MDADRRIEGGLYEVRITGRRWRIAMRQGHWDMFTTRIGADAHVRLNAAMVHFCAQGGDNLPEQLFHPVTGAQAARLEEFVAFGVHVIGRRATEDPLKTFFVTDVRWTETDEQAAPQPAVQPSLPFGNAQVKGAEQ